MHDIIGMPWPTRLLAVETSIADIQKFLGRADVSASRIYAEISIAMLQYKLDRVTDSDGRDLLGTVRNRHGGVIGAFAADLLSGDHHHVTQTLYAEPVR